jgi:hypothetical protein
MLIFRRSNCIVTASGIVTLRKQLFSAPVESGLQSALSLLKMSMVCSKHVEDYNAIYIIIE